jgi:hypothetical protein
MENPDGIHPVASLLCQFLFLQEKLYFSKNQNKKNEEVNNRLACDRRPFIRVAIAFMDGTAYS